MTRKRVVFTLFVEGDFLIELVVGVVEADAQKSLALQFLFEVLERLLPLQDAAERGCAGGCCRGVRAVVSTT